MNESSGPSLQFSKDLIHVGKEIVENGKNRLQLEGLAPAKEYVEGNLRLCLVYRDTLRESYCWFTVAYEADSRNAAAVTEVQGLDPRCVGDGQEDHVFVGNIEFVQSRQLCSRATFVGLQNIDDEIPDFQTWPATQIYMSVDGSFKVAPSAPVNGKVNSILDDMAVSFDQNTVSVIEGGPEVMYGIAQNRGSMPGEDTSQAPSAFQRVDICLSDHSVYAHTNNFSKNRFELTDVMFGPFGL